MHGDNFVLLRCHLHVHHLANALSKKERKQAREWVGWTIYNNQSQMSEDGDNPSSRVPLCKDFCKSTWTSIIFTIPNTGKKSKFTTTETFKLALKKILQTEQAESSQTVLKPLFTTPYHYLN